MLKFFRKIREKLLVERQLSRYLLYAIGEIALVVIGILIALQVNNWNENRKLKNQEITLLKFIHEEFSFNLNETERAVDVGHTIQDKCVNLLNNTGSNGLKLSRYESDSLIRSGLYRIVTADISSGVIDDILNSGKIHIIINDTLRKNLSNWPSRIEDVKEDEKWAVDFRNNYVIPFLNQHYSMIYLYREPDKQIKSGFEIDYRKIYNMVEFENIISTHREWYRKNARNYNGLKEAIISILEICERELEGQHPLS